MKLKGTRKVSGDKQIALTSRQMKIVEYINSNGQITNRELRKILNISAQAVHKELAKLIESKVIRSEGKGRSLRYILVDD